MHMARFLNPTNEDIVDKDKDIVDLIAATYSHKERAYKTNEEDISIPRIKDLEALKLLERLQLYEEQ